MKNSRHVRRSRVSPSLQHPFDTAARWIVRNVYPGRRRSHGHFGKGEALSRELMELGTGKKDCVYDYYVQKISRFLMISFICITGLAALLFLQHRQDRQIVDGVLERPGYGEGGSDQNLLLRVGAEESEAFDVHLDARTYTSSQVKAFLKNAAASLDAMLPGENASMDEVRTPLCLPDQLEDGRVSVEYYITPGGLIDENGTVCGQPDPEGSLITVNATLTCQDKTSTYECAARVYPPILSGEEQLRQDIRNAVEEARSEDPTGTQVRLPSTVDGRKLSWSYPKDSSLTLVMILLLVLPIAFWAREDSKVHDAAKTRQAQLELDYSQLLWKLTMLLSAGLTIRGAFTRITTQYREETGRGGGMPSDHSGRGGGTSAGHSRHRSSTPAGHSRHRSSMPAGGSGPGHGGKRYVYEEMLLTLREMNSGVPEASAYENFGRRCSLPMYIKLGSLLSQNLKKGSKGLTAMLEHEAVLSMDQHKMAVRKLGERASVKMLLPMILMFGVVLIILMVPAFLSM